MIRPFTLITMMAAAVSGAYLFGVKHRAQVLEDQIAAVADQSRLDAQRIRVLQAQWALETDPTRLSRLAADFTALTPMQPSQLVTLAALRTRLPPAGSPAPGDNPAIGALPPPDLTAPPPAPTAAPANAVADTAADAATDTAAHAASDATLPLPPGPPPGPPPAPPAAHLASRHPAPQPGPRFAANTASTPPGSRLAMARPVRTLPPPRPLYLARTLPAAPPPPAMPVVAQMLPARAIARPAPQDGGSMLGMAAELPPPQPLNGTSN